jgi:hypothetical protein
MYFFLGFTSGCTVFTWFLIPETKSVPLVEGTARIKFFLVGESLAISFRHLSLPNDWVSGRATSNI